MDRKTPPLKERARSPFLWLVLASLLVAVLALTIYTDSLVSEKEPNFLFYSLVPLVFMSGTATVAFAMFRLLKQSVTFIEILVTIVTVSIIVQFGGIIAKMFYYFAWQYPSRLYFPLNLVLWLALTQYALANWARVQWWVALAVALVGLGGGLLAGGLLVAVTGLSIAGS